MAFSQQASTMLPALALNVHAVVAYLASHWQICNSPGGLEPMNSEPPYPNMKKLGCSTDEQRQRFT
eukprot:1144950-Pelagomonas_calceolata.AAC.4